MSNNCFKTTNLNAGEIAVLMQLQYDRATEDGDIIGKQQRDSLICRGLAFRAYGFTTLTPNGECERILLLTDNQVLAEALAAGVNMETQATRCREMFETTKQEVERRGKPS